MGTHGKRPARQRRRSRREQGETARAAAARPASAIRPFRRLPPRPDADTVLLPGPLRRLSAWADTDTELLPRPRPGAGPAGRSGVARAAGDGPPRRSGPSTSPRRYPASRRRTWVSRAVLGVILALQMAASVHLRNTASTAEALCLNAGRAELAAALHALAGRAAAGPWRLGTAGFSPLLAAAADRVGGLAAARAVSLAAMLGATAVLYSLTRLLFNERVGLLAAVFFAATGPVIVLGNLATPEASSLFLLALAGWIVIRCAPSRWPACLAAAPVAVLAVAGCPGTAFFLPALALLTVLASLPYRRVRALAWPMVFAAGTLAAVRLGALAEPGLPAAVAAALRESAHASLAAAARAAAPWEGPLLCVAVLGAAAYTVRARNEQGELIAPEGGRARRLALGATLTATALLGPLALPPAGPAPGLSRAGYGLLFAAPMAGVGLARVIGDHFRRAQLGVAAWALMLTLGLAQSGQAFAAWPDSTPLIAALRPHLRPGARYLMDSPAVPAFYLAGDPAARPGQFTSLAAVAGRGDSPAASLRRAVREGRFRVVVYRGGTAAADQALARALAADPHYQLVSVVTAGSGGAPWYVWLRLGAPGKAR